MHSGRSNHLVVQWKRYIRKVGPPGLDNPIGLGLPPDPLGQVQFFIRAPPRYLLRSWLPEAGWWNWVYIRGSSGWQAGLDYQDSGLKQLGFCPLHGLWGKGLCPKGKLSNWDKEPL